MEAQDVGHCSLQCSSRQDTIGAEGERGMKAIRNESKRKRTDETRRGKEREKNAGFNKHGKITRQREFERSNKKE